MRVLRAADYRRMPWKNGGGVTAEIAVFPEGAGLDDFVWRASMAEVASDGPFSAFPGIDRTLTVLAGEGLRLAVGDADAVLLTPASEPFPFAADQPAHGALAGGAVTDLNVMTRRGRAEHMVRRLHLAGETAFGTPGATTLVFVESGGLRVADSTGDTVLGPRDCLWIEPGATVPVTPRGTCAVLEAAIDRIAR